MASKKGIAITAAIVVGIVGASFLIWLLPQESGVNVRQITPPPHQEVFQQVYTQNTELATDIDSKYVQWKSNQLSSETMSASIDEAKTMVGNMRKNLADVSPPQQWQESFGTYATALDVFNQYLDGIKSKVQAGDRGDDPEIDSLKQRWADSVDRAVKSVPL